MNDYILVNKISICSHIWFCDNLLHFYIKNSPKNTMAELYLANNLFHQKYQAQYELSKFSTSCPLFFYDFIQYKLVVSI